MKSYKTRHQLLLPEETSRRLEHMAQWGQALSEILVEALNARSDLLQTPKSDEAIGIRLSLIERNTSSLQLNQARLREVLTRMVVTGAKHSVRKIARAASAKLSAQLIDEIADRFANAASTTDAPTTRKLMSSQ